MKKILFIVLTSLFISSAFAGGEVLVQKKCTPNEFQVWYTDLIPEKCIPIDSEILRVSKMLSGKIDMIQSYKVSTLEEDIKTKFTDDNFSYKNSIQKLSAESEFNKNLFLRFIKYMSLKDTKRAVQIYTRNIQQISPFLPVCCVSYNYIGHKAMKNGIISLYSAGQDGIEYVFEYTYYKNGKLYSITKQTGFGIDSNGKIKKDTLIFFGSGEMYENEANWVSILSAPYNSNTINSALQKWLQNPISNSYFSKNYNSFITDMTKLWN